MKFSERIGKIKAKDTIQLEHIDNDLRNGLWNAIQIYYLDEFKSQWISESKYHFFLKILWHNFFKLPLDTLSDYTDSIKAQLRKWFFSWNWYEIYDFLEFISKTESPTDNERFKIFCNQILEKEISGYRFINGIIAPITSKSEISEIDSAIENTGKSNLTIVRTHLEAALRKLSERDTPDFRNFIKESISNDEKDSLGSALNKIKGKIN